MIEFAAGDLLLAEVEALVNPVNCVGVMGRGLALQFKRAFPANFEAYVAACARGEVRPGRMLVFDSGETSARRYIINFPTKRHWREKSRLPDIAIGLEALTVELQTRGIQSVAIPALGCGLGGLDWDEVRPLQEQAFAELPGVRVLVYRQDPLSRSSSKTLEERS